MIVGRRETYSFEIDATELFIEVLDDSLSKLAIFLSRENVVHESALEEFLRRKLLAHQ